MVRDSPACEHYSTEVGHVKKESRGPVTAVSVLRREAPSSSVPASYRSDGDDGELHRLRGHEEGNDPVQGPDSGSVEPAPGEEILRSRLLSAKEIIKTQEENIRFKADRLEHYRRRLALAHKYLERRSGV